MKLCVERGIRVAAFAGCTFWVGSSAIHGSSAHTLITHDCFIFTTALCVEWCYSCFFKEEIKAPRHSVSKCQDLVLNKCVQTKSKVHVVLQTFWRLLRRVHVCSFIRSPHKGRCAPAGWDIALEFRIFEVLAWVICCARCQEYGDE